MPNDIVGRVSTGPAQPGGRVTRRARPHLAE
jgi:hypothetical protein